MTRRSTQQSSFIDDLFAFLRTAPIWAGPVVALVVYAACRWVFPWVLSLSTSGSEFARGVAQPVSMFLFRFAPFAAAGVVLIWLAAEVVKRTDRRRLDQQTGAGSIRDLDWREFELLLCEAFRRQGFVVEHTGKDGPDGGVDLILNKAGGITLVQCKHWGARLVGVRVVRELLGVVSSEGVQSGIVVTSGQFSADATDFAAKNPIRLIDGQELTQMISKVRASVRTEEPRTGDGSPAGQAMVAPQMCPQCGAALVQRTAKRGARAGSVFLGCSQYPKCRYTRDSLR